MPMEGKSVRRHSTRVTKFIPTPSPPLQCRMTKSQGGCRLSLLKGVHHSPPSCYLHTPTHVTSAWCNNLSFHRIKSSLTYSLEPRTTSRQTLTLHPAKQSAGCRVTYPAASPCRQCSPCGDFWARQGRKVIKGWQHRSIR